MSAVVSRATVSGFECMTLANSRVEATIIPQLGGRVWELSDRKRGRQWIWHREGVALSQARPGAAYDEVWAGGWEELFPNDAPGRFEGRELPDHGDWWAMSWVVEEASQHSDAVIRLTGRTEARQASCLKEFRLGADSDSIQVRYRIESEEREPFHFLFKQHFALAVEPGCRLVLPGGTVTAVDPTFGTILPGPGPYVWPHADGADLSRVPTRSETAREFVYVTDLEEGWCGVDDLVSGASLRLRFDQAIFPHTWLFLSYGGWRDCYTAVLEPCTNRPKDLVEATRLGQSACLGPGQVFETTVVAVVGETGAGEGLSR